MSFNSKLAIVLFHFTLMHRDALRFLEDAKLLANRGDSAHLLVLLGFELLLKLVHEVTLGRKTKHLHKYQLIFSDLPPATQEEILKVARTRIGPSNLNSAPLDIFTDWGKNFIDLRYCYEKYEGLSEEEYLNLGKAWEESGAKPEEATFRYHPEELFAMVESLKQMAQNLANNSFKPTPNGAA